MQQQHRRPRAQLAVGELQAIRVHGVERDSRHGRQSSASSRRSARARRRGSAPRAPRRRRRCASSGRTPGVAVEGAHADAHLRRVVGVAAEQVRPALAQKHFSKPPSGWRQALTSSSPRAAGRCARRSRACAEAACRCAAGSACSGSSRPPAGSVSSKRTPPQRQPPVSEGYRSRRRVSRKAAAATLVSVCFDAARLEHHLCAGESAAA